MIITFCGVVAAVMAIVAAYFELRLVFPPQRLVVSLSMSHVGPEAAVAWRWPLFAQLRIANGASFVNHWKIVATVSGAEFGLPYGSDDSRDGVDDRREEPPWTVVISPDPDEAHVRGEGDSLFPEEAILSPGFQVSSEEFSIYGRWWTDRSPPISFTTTIRWNGKEARYSSVSENFHQDVAISAT